MMADDDRDRGFTVVDRRASASGEARPASEPKPAPPASEVPRVDFASFVLSLGTSALYELGVVGDPTTGSTRQQPNLALARQTIEALEMLQGKTRGNLDAEEAKLLEALLYELRMRFVEVSRSPGASGSPPAGGE